MRYFSLFLLVMLTVSCGGSKKVNEDLTSVNDSPDEVVMLIIAPQGIEPNSDLIGFNQLVKGVAGPISKRLSNQLLNRGVKSLSIIDQDPKLDLGQKIFNHTKDRQVQSVIVLTLDMTVEGNDKQLILRIQKAPLEFNGVEHTIKIGEVDEKSYLLSSSESGYYKGSIADIADDYIKRLMLN